MAVTPLCVASQNSAPSVAFYYGNDAPVDLFDQFDWLVVDDRTTTQVERKRLARYGTTLFAYISVGEAPKDTPDGGVAPPSTALIGENEDWGTRIADLTNPAWSDYIIKHRIRPLWQKGYRAFFLDTLDSYKRISGSDKEAVAQRQALAALIKRIHREFPGSKLLLNRGFGIVDEVHQDIVGVAAESLYRGWNEKDGRYTTVEPDAREWLLNRLQRIHKRFDLPTIAIDYLPAKKHQAARKTAQQIASHSVIPYVTNNYLTSVGVGTIEPLPRKVLVVYDKSRLESTYYSKGNFFRSAAMPLEYLGYGAVYRDVSNLPDGVLKGRYAGVVTWFDRPLDAPSKFRNWLTKRVENGVPIAMLRSPGFTLDGKLAQKLGLQQVAGVARSPAHVVRHDSMLGFEGMPSSPPPGESGFALGDGKNTAHLVLRADDKHFAPVVTGDWGGITLSPWTVQYGNKNQSRWLLNPFRFFRQALDLPTMPVPDATTENGLRYVMSQIDGDGFASKASIPGTPFAGTVVRRQILKEFQLPVTASLIVGAVSENGVNPEISGTLKNVARRLFQMPWVHVGTHTYSHPFAWQKIHPGELAGEGETSAGFAYNLAISNYHYSLRQEVVGSADWINQHILPEDKRVHAILWSGDALPPPKAIRLADENDLTNINGGNTDAISGNPSLTHVTPMLRPFGFHTQVLAPIINENLYTNDFIDPLWGYQRVIETFQLTNKPRRLKPIDIYYHFYSVTDPAALRALKKVYRYVEKQPTLSVYVGDYSRIARGWYHAGVARRLAGGWQITGATDMRTLRLPKSLGWPDLQSSQNVAGVRDLSQGRYVALTGDQRVRLMVADDKPQAQDASPYIVKSNGRIKAWEQNGSELRLRVAAELKPLSLTLGGVAGCSISTDSGDVGRAADGARAVISFDESAPGPVLVDCDTG